MNALSFVCVLLLILLFGLTLFASSINAFFTEEELIEMGIYFGSIDKEAGMIA